MVNRVVLKPKETFSTYKHTYEHLKRKMIKATIKTNLTKQEWQQALNILAEHFMNPLLRIEFDISEFQDEVQ